MEYSLPCKRHGHDPANFSGEPYRQAQRLTPNAVMLVRSTTPPSRLGGVGSWLRTPTPPPVPPEGAPYLLQASGWHASSSSRTRSPDTASGPRSARAAHTAPQLGPALSARSVWPVRSEVGMRLPAAPRRASTPPARQPGVVDNRDRVSIPTVRRQLSADRDPPRMTHVTLTTDAMQSSLPHRPVHLQAQPVPTQPIRNASTRALQLSSSQTACRNATLASYGLVASDIEDPSQTSTPRACQLPATSGSTSAEEHSRLVSSQSSQGLVRRRSLSERILRRTLPAAPSTFTEVDADASTVQDSRGEVTLAETPMLDKSAVIVRDGVRCDGMSKLIIPQDTLGGSTAAPVAPITPISPIMPLAPPSAPSPGNRVVASPGKSFAAFEQVGPPCIETKAAARGHAEEHVPTSTATSIPAVDASTQTQPLPSMMATLDIELPLDFLSSAASSGRLPLTARLREVSRLSNSPSEASTTGFSFHEANALSPRGRKSHSEAQGDSRKSMPAMMSALAVCNEQEEKFGSRRPQCRLHRLELRVAPSWRDMATTTDKEPEAPKQKADADSPTAEKASKPTERASGPDGSLQLSPLTPSLWSGTSGSHSTVSTLPSPLMREGILSRMDLENAVADDVDALPTFRAHPEGDVQSDGVGKKSSPSRAPLLGVLRKRAASLSQRLLRKERQCQALQEALERCHRNIGTVGQVELLSTSLRTAGEGHGPAPATRSPLAETNADAEGKVKRELWPLANCAVSEPVVTCTSPDKKNAAPKRQGLPRRPLASCENIF
mmetsp:Transcript_6427/g.14059  ORF Transcript_6427/g.14059 Transcript_6427/m.14059 type:complete len:779 (-) Transcript_6427:150-2486(-)